jgi:hypothetical protein
MLLCILNFKFVFCICWNVCLLFLDFFAWFFFFLMIFSLFFVLVYFFLSLYIINERKCNKESKENLNYQRESCRLSQNEEEEWNWILTNYMFKGGIGHPIMKMLYVGFCFHVNDNRDVNGASAQVTWCILYYNNLVTHLSPIARSRKGWDHF